LISYLHTNYMEKISINKLAKLFCTNRTTLADFFRRNTGDSIIAHLIKIRIDVACLMLRNTELPVAEITRRTGFNDLTHFARMFKKKMNQTPSEYREKYCWMLSEKDKLARTS
jgi:transcriptional regulator GlxA family with amidase domain